MVEFPIGMKNTYEVEVVEENTASRVRKGGVMTFSTPALVAGMECCCSYGMQALLDDTQSSVGMSISVKHMAATPIGMHVRFESELIEQDRRRLVFKILAFDEMGQVGEGIHERLIIDKEKQAAKVEAKRQAFLEMQKEK